MKRTAMVGLLALVSWSTQAAHDVPGWRAGAAASFFDFELDDEFGEQLGGQDLSDNSVGGKAWIQYQFNERFAIEGAYHNSSTLEATAVVGGSGTDYDLEFDGFSAQGLLFLPIPSEELNAYVKAGYYDFDDELSTDGFVSSTGSESGLVLGAGGTISIHDNFAIRADLDWFDADVGELWAVNLGLQYYFGGAKAVAPVVAAAEEPPPPPPPPPADADGDGVTDDADQCPDTPAGERVGPYGCTCAVTRQVEFEFDSADLTDAGRATLDEVAENLTRLKFVEGTVEGHTDSEGEEDYNQALSERRALAVATYLETKGIGAGRLAAVGLGESQPVADNETEEGRAENRRVVLRRTDCDAPKE